MDGFVFNFLACFASVCCLMVVTATRQDLPDSCGGQPDCEDFLSDGQWRGVTERCCADRPDTVYHCQEQDGKVIVACLLPVTCPPGQVSKLTEKEDGSGVISLSCKECDEGFYQPHSLPSFRFRYPRCQWRKQACPAVSGKVVVSVGDSSQDSRCRCRWEEGWVPRYPGSRSQCIDPAGFVKDDMCECVKHDCDEGTLLGKDYKCTDPTKTPPSTHEGSPTDGRRHEDVQNDNQYPGGLPKERGKGELARFVYSVLLSGIGAVFILISLAAIAYGCIEFRKTYKTD